MSLLTLAPPTFGFKEKGALLGTSNGKNLFLFALYWTGHPHAAAIAAQEVREARSSFLPSMSVIGVALAAYHFLLVPMVRPNLDPISVGITYFMVATIALAFFMAWPPRKRSTNLKGEATECVVEAQRYGMTLEDAIAEGAAQLKRNSGYKFGKFTLEEVTARLRAEIPAAEKWVERNRALIDRAGE